MIKTVKSKDSLKTEANSPLQLKNEAKEVSQGVKHQIFWIIDIVVAKTEEFEKKINSRWRLAW